MDEIQKRMSEVQCPLLNLHGDADKLCTLDGSQLLQDKASSKDKTLKVGKQMWPSRNPASPSKLTCIKVPYLIHLAHRESGPVMLKFVVRK